MSRDVLNTVAVLRAVRDNQPLASKTLKQFIEALVNGHVADYQAAAFLMAVYLRGLSVDATVALTEAMRDSGRVIDLSHIRGIKADKHSTGGVGDKISLILAPLVASVGVPVPMIAGRGLGHTGGTLDKLVSIPGFRVDLAPDAFAEQVANIGVCIAGQTEDLAPADRILYALRDVTATIESVPLITASILSKKLASGIDALTLDIKVGRAAFMHNLDEARALAESLIAVGRGAGIQVRAVLTRMDAPIGRTIGNALEVLESIDVLRDAGPRDTRELTLLLGTHMLAMAKEMPADEARQRLEASLASGDAWQKFRAMVQAQGGDLDALDNPQSWSSAPRKSTVRSTRAGVLHNIDGLRLGQLAMSLGAGRQRAEDRIDPTVGLEIRVEEGQAVQAGDTLAIVHHRDALDALEAEIFGAFTIGEEAIAVEPRLIEVLGA